MPETTSIYKTFLPEANFNKCTLAKSLKMFIQEIKLHLICVDASMILLNICDFVIKQSNNHFQSLEFSIHSITF